MVGIIDLSTVRPDERCTGCGEPGATEVLWLAAPLGLCCVVVHSTHGCANAARELRGGGRFVSEPRSKEERELAAGVRSGGQSSESGGRDVRDAEGSSGAGGHGAG